MKKVLIAFCLSLVAFCTALSQDPKPREVSKPALPNPSSEVLSIFSRGFDAVAAGNLDQAIQIFDQGIKLAPNEPALWVNKAIVLMNRGIGRYNEALNISDKEEKKQKSDVALMDLKEALTASSRALELNKTIVPPLEPALREAYDSHMLGSRGVHAGVLWLVTLKVDNSYLSTAAEAFRDYLSMETDAARKIEAQLQLGGMFLIENRYHDAFTTYQAILTIDADNVNANLGAAVSLLGLSNVTNDQTNLQDGINFLARFVELAPENHYLRGSARETLGYLRQPAAAWKEGEKLTGVTTMVGPPKESAVAGGVLNGRAITLSKPAYPRIAKFARASGTVVVQVIIDEEGNVTDARAITGHPLLRGVSVASARTSRFSPTTLSGMPVKVTGVITYNFVAQ